jgi:hypothetical protein
MHVQRTQRIVEQENARPVSFFSYSLATRTNLVPSAAAAIAVERTSDGDPLLLSPTQIDAPFANLVAVYTVSVWIWVGWLQIP